MAPNSGAIRSVFRFLWPQYVVRFIYLPRVFLLEGHDIGSLHREFARRCAGGFDLQVLALAFINGQPGKGVEGAHSGAESPGPGADDESGVLKLLKGCAQPIVASPASLFEDRHRGGQVAIVLAVVLYRQVDKKSQGIPRERHKVRAVIDCLR